MNRFLYFFLLFILPFCGSGQSMRLSPNAQVSVLTCGVGNEVYSLFGHTAIRISDPGLNLDMVYNYGAFDFATPNFVLRFSKGDLQYFVTADRFDDFLYTYNYDHRSIWEQELALSADQKQHLFDELNETMASDKKFYTYKFIDRNCTTMVVDILNRTLGGSVIQKTTGTDETYREVLFPYFDNHFYEQLGTSIIFGSKVDQEAKHIFLPVELMQSIDKANYNGAPLLKSGKTWFEFAVPKPDGMWWNNWYTYVLLLTLIVVANSRIITAVYLCFAAALGLFFTVAGLYSYHGELAWNYNALLFNPLLFAVVFFSIRKNLGMARLFSIIVAAGILVYLVLMLNKIHLLIVLPIVAAHLIILGRNVLKRRE